MTTHHPHHLFQQPWPEGDLRFFQLGFVVDDIPAHANRWATVFGVGPFYAMQRHTTKCTYRGEESSLDMAVAIAQAGPVQIELIVQYDDRPSVFRDFYAQGSSGFHQVCTVTADYDGKVAHYEGLGYPLACEIMSGGQRVGYVDTFADFGFVTELVEGGDNYFKTWSRLEKTCREWDGKDPVRYF